MRSLKTQQSYYKVRLGVFLFVLIAASVLCMVSCKTQPLLIESEKVLTETIREEVRDTIVVVGEDKALVKALLTCDSVGQVLIMQILSYEAGRQIKPPDIEINDNILTATAKIDSFSIYLKLKDRYIERNEAKTVTQTIEVNKLTKWQQTRIYIANVLLILLPLALGYKYRHIIIGFIKTILKL